MQQPIIYGALSLLLSLSFMGNLCAQRVKAKFGKLSQEEFATTEFPGDPDASAIILYERANIYWQVSAEKLQMVYEYHKRIKILDESAIDAYASWELGPYYSHRRSASISQIKGFTYNADENGNIERVKLEPKAVYTEKPDKKHTIKSFGMPQVKVGSVIELSYRYTTNRLTVVDNQFLQTQTPKLYSEVTLAAPDGVIYNPVFMGEVVSLGKETKTSNASSLKLIANSYWARNIPAFKDEAYLSHWKNHAFRVQFTLTAITWPGYEKDWRQTWPKINRTLLEDEDISPYLSQNGDVRKLWYIIRATAKEETPEAYLDAIITYLRTELEWNGRLSKYPSESPGGLLREEKGNSAALNMMLIALCREAGLEADPVLISTRKHGMAQQVYPMIRQFNHLIARVGTNESPQFIDVASTLHAHQQIPERDLNGAGFILHPDGYQWVSLSPQKGFQHRVTSRLTMDEEGVLRGQMSADEKAYAASSLRSYYDADEMEEEEFVAEVLAEGMVDGSMSAESVENLEDLNAPLKVKCEIETADFSQKAGNMLYFEPM
ncbi:MAG: DUF3857 domain-containing protein, partial [Bacteroidota bacterium]